MVIFFVLGISLSRIFLALHYPFDTVFGWVIGFLLLYFFNRTWDSIGTWAQKQSIAKQVGAAFGLSMLMLSLGVGERRLAGDWTMPVTWYQNAARAVSDVGGHMPDPLSISVLITSSATLFGLLAGLVWITSKGGTALHPG